MAEVHPLAAWLRDHPEVAINQNELAVKLGCSGQRLSQIFNRPDLPPSRKLAVRIHEFTGGEVPASVLRPDIWRRPEDVVREAAQ